MSNNFFHEMNRAPMIEFPNGTQTTVTDEYLTTPTNDYERHLLSIGQLRQYKYSQAAR